MEKEVLENEDFPAEDLAFEEISSPLAAEMLEFTVDVDDGAADLFPDPSLRTSNVSSSSVNNDAGAAVAGAASSASDGGACCYDESSFSTDNFSPFPSMDAAELSALLGFDPDPGNDVTASFDCLTTVQQPTALGQTLPSMAEDQAVRYDQLGQLAMQQPPDSAVAHIYEHNLMLPPPPQPPFLDMASSSSCSFMDPVTGAFYSAGVGVMGCGEGSQSQGYYTIGGVMMGADPRLPLQEFATTDHKMPDGSGGGMGFYLPPDQLIQSHAEIQVVGEGQQMVGGCSSPARVATEMPALDESNFKVGKLSAVERKEKIERYIRKKNQRNFTKKIKYACRKTLADSRPRVRGRFAKNDELGEVTRPSSNLHDLEEEDVMPKEEDDDILAHISGLNSFKYNYTLESWI